MEEEVQQVLSYRPLPPEHGRRRRRRRRCWQYSESLKRFTLDRKEEVQDELRWDEKAQKKQLEEEEQEEEEKEEVWTFV